MVSAPIEFAEVAPLWEKTYSANFRIDEEIWQRNMVHHPAVVASLRGTGWIAVLKGPVPDYGGNPGHFHLAALAFDSPAAGQEAVSKAVNKATELGAKSLAFGQDGDHIWPGVPHDHPHVIAALESGGFTIGGSVDDLQRDLTGYTPRDAAAISPGLRPAGQSDERGLLEYFTREFPGRWRVDVMQQFHENAARVMVWEVDGAIEGHALIQTSDTHHPIGGAVWRNDLGPQWGALGSIGVSARLRGGGSGGRLLDASLLELSRRQVRECIIDWTGLSAFYEKYGFKITRKYQSASLTLGTP
jgi:hypothetical protein